MGVHKSLKKKKSDVTADVSNSSLGTLAKYGIEITSWKIIGLLLCIVCGIGYAYIVCQIHESRMFFTGIMEVEREISFRTENGLYYSYYKQLLRAPSFWKGVYELTQDKLTEHPSPINVLSRMNVYQEVLLAATYRFTPFISSFLEPVFFYIYFVFMLHGMLVCALYLMAWSISGTWIAGCLTVIFYTINSTDVTRVETYMPLRENFSLPCLWVQLLIITVYFKPHLQETRARVCEKGLMISTFFFALMWQFNQFALLLQAMALFGCQVLNVVEMKKLLHVYMCQLSSMVIICFLQFFNTMILSGFLISFIAASILLMKIQEFLIPNLHRRVFKVLLLVLNIAAVFLLALSFNFLLKQVFHQEADEHINRFVLTKFGFNSSIDFDVRLYLCNGGFNFLGKDFFLRLSENFVLPLYVVAHVTMLVLLGLSVFTDSRTLTEYAKSKEIDRRIPHWLTPELTYHCIQMVFFGAVGIIAMRMKYFWTPYMCIFASVCLFKPEPWVWIAKKFNYTKEVHVKFLQTIIGVILMSYIASLLYGDVSSELNNMREFYDPDTVELMDWINNNTDTSSSFSGSMQLLAGVKLCTGRPITNHPHYEDKSLRLKTKEIYKYYGRHSPEIVHSVLKKYQTDFIIMEDSICLVPLREGCGLPYIMDMEAGLEFDALGKPLRADAPPRFCDQIRRNEPRFSNLFKLVLQNKTFRVYKVL